VEGRIIDFMANISAEYYAILTSLGVVWLWNKTKDKIIQVLLQDQKIKCCTGMHNPENY